MRSGYRIIVFVILVMILGCGKQEKDVETNSLYVVTTTGMIGDLVKNIAGDLVTVESLMGPGVDPHLYKASQGDISKLARARVIFYNGLHLEGKMTDIFEKMSRKKKVVAISKKIDTGKLIPLQKQGSLYDPHIWFDVSLWRETIPIVLETLVELDPDNRSIYENNAGSYTVKLDSLHQWVINKFQQIPKKRRVMITAHDAFSYFGRAYDVKVYGLQGISTVAEYGVNDVTRLVDIIVENDIKAVFVETSVPTRSIEAVVAGCEARDYRINIGGSLYSDAMGEPGSGADFYIGMVEANVNTIVNALK